MKEEFGIDVSVGDFFAESKYRYDHGAIRLLAYYTSWRGGQFTLNAHAEYRWIDPIQLEEFEFAAADIPFVKKLKQLQRIKDF